KRRGRPTDELANQHKIQQVKWTNSCPGLPKDHELEGRVHPSDHPQPSISTTIKFNQVHTQPEANAHSLTVNIYTDGSKLETGKVGSAFIAFFPTGRTVERKFKLDRCCSVFQSELFAILQALNWLSSQSPTTANIYSDSLS